MADGVEIRFKCQCMRDEAAVTVPFRRESENIIEWMQSVVQSAIYLEHRKLSPLCMSETMEYAKLPAPENADYIGGKPKLN